MPSVVFLCTANRFRSPLAAAIFRQSLVEEERKRTSTWSIGAAGDWTVGSAGLQAADGLPALPDVLQAGRKLGLDLYAHRSQAVSHQLLLRYDLVLVMEQSHRETLLSGFPELR